MAAHMHGRSRFWIVDRDAIHRRRRRQQQKELETITWHQNQSDPGPDHPIMIEANPSRVVVLVGGRIVADSTQALTLREAKYPAVQYIPRKDVDMSLLQRTDHATYCPYKGDCAYYSIRSGGERSTNAVWTYEAPYAAVAEIKDHLAFYPHRVDEIKEQGEGWSNGRLKFSPATFNREPVTTKRLILRPAGFRR